MREFCLLFTTDGCGCVELFAFQVFGPFSPRMCCRGLVSSGLRNCLEPCCVCQAKFASMCRPFGCTVQYSTSGRVWTSFAWTASACMHQRSSSSVKAQQARSQRKPKKAKRKESSQGRRRESAKHGTCARTWLRRANRRRTCPWGKCWMSQGGFKNA